MTLKVARDEALRLSGLLRQHPTLRDWLDEEKHAEGEALRQDRHDRVHATLAALLEGYAGWLEQQGKPSAKQVRGAIKRHVLEAWPSLAAAKANSLDKRDLTKIVARVVEAGKGREAAKLRAYLRAAYAAAMRAEADPTIPRALQGFHLTVNPAGELASLSQYNQHRDTVLTLPELRALWVRLEEFNGATGSALRLCVLLGGQRPTQLVRIKSADVDLHAGTVTIYDPKGRRLQARRHVLPLTVRARQEIEPLVVQHPDGYLLSSTGGRVPLRQETLSNAFHDIAKVMRSGGEVFKDIRLGDLRGTIETLLAANGISMEVRAQLQSHGLGGIQNRHYDRHSYEGVHGSRGSGSGRAMYDDPRVAVGPLVLSESKRERRRRQNEGHPTRRQVICGSPCWSAQRSEGRKRGGRRTNAGSRRQRVSPIFCS